MSEGVKLTHVARSLAAAGASIPQPALDRDVKPLVLTTEGSWRRSWDPPAVSDGLRRPGVRAAPLPGRRRGRLRPDLHRLRC